MYYSRHNNDITYFFTWGKHVLIEGNGAIYRADTDIGKENWTQERAVAIEKFSTQMV